MSRTSFFFRASTERFLMSRRLISVSRMRSCRAAALTSSALLCPGAREMSLIRIIPVSPVIHRRRAVRQASRRTTPIEDCIRRSRRRCPAPRRRQTRPARCGFPACRPAVTCALSMPMTPVTAIGQHRMRPQTARSSASVSSASGFAAFSPARRTSVFPSRDCKSPVRSSSAASPGKRARRAVSSAQSAASSSALQKSISSVRSPPPVETARESSNAAGPLTPNSVN